ncbi:MAG: type III-A CRISPR-associated protein Cas10/Csm1 [Deltaproteobacteria bacterium]|nr:type III-A CRISPR-associated protein Cas10/Csm1 [Deltaproteobacteria bacterium]
MIVLSALLHDIGKFCQRVGQRYATHLEGEYTEIIGGRVRFLHTLYTYHFIENDLPLPKELEHHRAGLARLASAHHHPDERNLEEMSLMIADRLSSTRGRIDHLRSESKAGSKKSRLASVFDTIELAHHQFLPPGSWFHNLAPLGGANESIFPRKGYPEGESEEYRDIYLKFNNELKDFDHNRPFALFLDGLISLLEKYTWCVPSSTRNASPDISLFDHSITTAGLAQSLFLFHVYNGGIPHLHDETKKFILLTGSLSGIQDYIFGISRSYIKGASQIVRARSFFLQAVVRSVILNIQERFNVLSVCRIIDLSGKFILLLPHLNHVLEGLDELDNEVQDWFRRKFKGILALNLDWSARLSQQDFFCDSFKEKLDLAKDKLEATGSKKPARTVTVHNQIMENDYDEFEDGNCALCGVNPADAVFSNEEWSEPGLDQIKTFTDIAAKSKRDLGLDKPMGRPWLGFLKADIDNLGLLFSRGLDNRLSIARFCTMSRMLNLFFSDYLVHLAEQEFPDIYLFYAGGNDLFLVGPWNQVVEFAVTVRKKLDAFCCRNQDITLSAGMAVTNPGLPMRLTAGLVQSALKAAKEYNDSARVKDSICLLGETLSWEELASLAELGLKLDKAS